MFFRLLVTPGLGTLVLSRQPKDAEANRKQVGIVRDSTLNNTNDFEVFGESWEAIVPKVIESLKLTMTLCDTGQGAIDVTPAAYCTAS
jgi:hypothetical protein